MLRALHFYVLNTAVLGNKTDSEKCQTIMASVYLKRPGVFGEYVALWWVPVPRGGKYTPVTENRLGDQDLLIQEMDGIFSVKYNASEILIWLKLLIALIKAKERIHLNVVRFSLRIELCSRKPFLINDHHWKLFYREIKHRLVILYRC